VFSARGQLCICKGVQLKSELQSTG